MKAEIHPEYHQIKATCSCGHVIETRSTLSEDIHLDVCSSCHPFYTGKQKTLDAGGRVERFRRRFGNRSGGDASSNEASANEDSADEASEPAESGDNAETSASAESTENVESS
jgi:large subunit ribosomal protein L31